MPFWFNFPILIFMHSPSYRIVFKFRYCCHIPNDSSDLCLCCFIKRIKILQDKGFTVFNKVPNIIDRITIELCDRKFFKMNYLFSQIFMLSDMLRYTLTKSNVFLKWFGITVECTRQIFFIITGKWILFKI